MEISRSARNDRIHFFRSLDKSSRQDTEAHHETSTIYHQPQAQTGKRFFSFAQTQIENLITTHPDYFPLYSEGGKWKHGGEAWTNWCEGFLGGMIWLFHLHAGEPMWQERAEHNSRLLEARQLDRNVHDLGFVSGPPGSAGTI